MKLGWHITVAQTLHSARVHESGQPLCVCAYSPPSRNNRVAGETYRFFPSTRHWRPSPVVPIRRRRSRAPPPSTTSSPRTHTRLYAQTYDAYAHVCGLLKRVYRFTTPSPIKGLYTRAHICIYIYIYYRRFRNPSP